MSMTRAVSASKPADPAEHAEVPVSRPAPAAGRAPGRSRAQRGNVLVSGAGPAGLMLAALAGDAGYCPSPLSGQGTSLALVGAYVLAGALQAASGDHSIAFPAYQHRMQDFVARNQQIAIGNTKRFIPQTRRQIWLQNQTIRALPYLPGKKPILDQATKGVREAANAITLEESPGGGGGSASVGPCWRDDRLGVRSQQRMVRDGGVS
jgi:hypothetical protein